MLGGMLGDCLVGVRRGNECWMMGPGFQGGWMNNVPVMMLVVVTT